MRASPGGKEAGFYFDSNKFVTLDRMGDGVSEMVALIVELCTEVDKIFVLEKKPETNLHPAGLKSLLELVRHAADRTEFFISTHSNIVVRELGEECNTKIFQVSREGPEGNSPSAFFLVDRTPEDHLRVLRDLGYEFLDYSLYEGWLFLEEASAETIISQILIPFFVPELRTTLRTYSAGGATNVAPSVAEFLRLVVFVHLQPIYENRLWVRVDGDSAGIETVKTLRAKFPGYDEEAFGTFGKDNFKLYYPAEFQDNVAQVLAIPDKKLRQKNKTALLRNVIDWTKTTANPPRSYGKRAQKSPSNFSASYRKFYRFDKGMADQFATPSCGEYHAQLHPVVPPQVSHFRHVPLRTMVKLPHSGQDSPT